VSVEFPSDITYETTIFLSILLYILVLLIASRSGYFTNLLDTKLL